MVRFGMIKLLQIFLIFIILISSGCLNSAITGSDNQEEGKPVQLKTETTNVFTDDASIIKADLKKDLLLLTVRYGGGCKEHEFELYWDGLFMESNPLQVKLELSHNSNEDMCRALLTDELYFNLSIIKSRLVGLGQNIIVINIYEPGTSEIKYTFDYRFTL